MHATGLSRRLFACADSTLVDSTSDWLVIHEERTLFCDCNIFSRSEQDRAHLSTFVVVFYGYKGTRVSMKDHAHLSTFVVIFYGYKSTRVSMKDRAHLNTFVVIFYAHKSTRVSTNHNEKHKCDSSRRAFTLALNR